MKNMLLFALISIMISCEKEEDLDFKYPATFLSEPTRYTNSSGTYNQQIKFVFKDKVNLIYTSVITPPSSSVTPILTNGTYTYSSDTFMMNLDSPWYKSYKYKYYDEGPTNFSLVMGKKTVKFYRQ